MIILELRAENPQLALTSKRLKLGFFPVNLCFLMPRFQLSFDLCSTSNYIVSARTYDAVNILLYAGVSIGLST